MPFAIAIYGYPGSRIAVKIQDVEIKNDVQKEALDRLSCVAGVINSEIEDYDIKIAEKFGASKEAQLLETIPGVGKYSSVHIMPAIGDIKRFPSDEELASYAGLVPKISQSGERRRDSGLKPGDMQLRTVLIQDANAAIKMFQIFQEILSETEEKKRPSESNGFSRKKKAEIIYVMLTRGEPYRENYRK